MSTQKLVGGKSSVQREVRLLENEKLQTVAARPLRSSLFFGFMRFNQDSRSQEREGCWRRVEANSPRDKKTGSIMTNQSRRSFRVWSFYAALRLGQRGTSWASYICVGGTEYGVRSHRRAAPCIIQQLPYAPVDDVSEGRRPLLLLICLGVLST